MQDNNAERRNLMMISIGFIIYVLGDAELLDHQLQVGIINMVFQNTEFLTLFTWLSFFWFLWRYWLANKINIDLYRNEMPAKLDFYIDKIYAVKKINNFIYGEHEKKLYGEFFYDKSNPALKLVGVVDRVSVSRFMKDEKKPDKIYLTSKKDKLYVFIRHVEYIIFNKKFSDFYVPYVFSITAILCGIYELW